MIEIGKRYWEIDFLRGLSVVLMIFDHFMFSVMDVLPSVWEFFGVGFFESFNEIAAAYWVWPPRLLMHNVISSLFFVLCGISCTFSRSNLRRGVLAAAVALAITLVTSLAENFIEGITIRFGVVHMLAAAMLMYGAVQLIGIAIRRIKTNRITVWLARLLPAFVGLTLLILYLSLWGGFDFSAQSWVSRVDSKGGVWDQVVSVFVYVNESAFASSDYFPILPFTCFVLMGGGIGEIIYHTRARNFAVNADGKWNRPVCFVGRHALIFYVSHQVAIVALLFLAGLVVKIFGG